MFLAKSNPEETIQEHTDNLLEEYRKIKNLYGDKINIDWSILELACLYHDLGKMNEIFQNKIKRIPNRTGREEVPHGYVSIGFIDVYSLLERYTEEEISLLVTAVAKHHRRDFDIEEREDDLIEEIERLKDIVVDFKYDKFPNISDYIDIYSIESLYDNEIREFENEKDKINYILIKGLLNRIDYAASGYYEIEYKNDFLIESLDKYKKSWGENAEYNELQSFMLANQDKNVIAVAETGYGKTEAGLLWIGNNKGFFTLPLRSAINSIYDRVREILEGRNLDERLALLHSDSLNELFTRTSMEKKEEELSLNDLEIMDYNDRARQKSLPLTVSTIDQIFKFVYKYRGFEEELATLSYSKVVIDEIQMYSPDLLAYLLVGLDMINKVGGKFSIITATLPPFILDLLKERGLEFVMPEKPYYKEDRIRHCMELKEEEINGEFIEEKYKENKVLVIVNTVKKAQELYEYLKDRVDEDQLNVFHGGFIKKDRKFVEKKIVKFGDKDNEETGIWICTQVAEASLDIDFDILLTELSDINGLFQRMGRCYRNRNLEEGRTNIYVFDGGKEETSGVGFVNDKEIFNLSKDKLREEFKNKKSWRITEKNKLDIINDVYTSENIKETDYYKNINSSIKYVEGTFTYELSKNEVIKRFRMINSIDVIPRDIYDGNIDLIENSIEIIREKSVDRNNEEERKKQRVRKNKARIELSDLTVSIPFYFSNYNNTELIEITEYEHINIYNCKYDKKFGIKHIKDEVDENYQEQIKSII